MGACRPHMARMTKQNTNRRRQGMPSKEQILEFIQTSDTPAGKREIAKAFGLKGPRHPDLVEFQSQAFCPNLINAKLEKRSSHVEIGFPRGDDSQLTLGIAEHLTVNGVVPQER